MRSSVHQVEHLRRVQQLFEASQELDALIVSTFRVDKHQQRTGAGRRTRRLPETSTHNSTFTSVCAAGKLRCVWCCSKRSQTVDVNVGLMVSQRTLMNLTVRVDAVECRRRDDGHFTLTQRTLRGQLLLTA